MPEGQPREPSRSRIIDVEAVACRVAGGGIFDRIRYRHHDRSVFLLPSAWCLAATGKRAHVRRYAVLRNGEGICAERDYKIAPKCLGGHLVLWRSQLLGIEPQSAV